MMRMVVRAASAVALGWVLAGSPRVAAGQGAGEGGAAIPPGAAPGAAALVTLVSGETLRCVIAELKADSIVLIHPVLGRIEAPRAMVTLLRLVPPPESTPPESAPPESVPPESVPPESVPPDQSSTASSPSESPTAASVAEPEAPPPPSGWLRGWKGSVEGGVNGSEGNTETRSFRFGAGLERLTPTLETRASGSYAYSTEAGEKTKSRAELNFRNDWLFKDSPWGYFATGKAEFDEFQDWNWRLSGSVGPSYTIIKDERTTLRLRAGAGVVRELGGERDELMPEALLGVDYSLQITKTQKFFVNSDFLPNLDEAGEYRWNTKAGYEIVIDPQSNISLKFGLDTRYNSDPGGDADKADVDYFALLAWSF